MIYRCFLYYLFSEVFNQKITMLRKFKIFMLNFNLFYINLFQFSGVVPEPTSQVAQARAPAQNRIHRLQLAQLHHSLQQLHQPQLQPRGLPSKSRHEYHSPHRQLVIPVSLRDLPPRQPHVPKWKPLPRIQYFFIRSVFFVHDHAEQPRIPDVCGSHARTQLFGIHRK